MKKIIKIFSIILFIIFVLGITTSEAALKVEEGTSSKEMIDWLNKTTEGSDGFLTGISNSVRIKNPNLYCRQRGIHISASGWYDLDVEEDSKNTKTYPTDDSINGHLKAYIFAADGYGDNKTNGLRQEAWWQILAIEEGKDSEKNALLKIAEVYQEYKISEDKVKVNYDNAKININNNTIIYGPIKITYSYRSAKYGDYSDNWGGFDYAFSSEEGTIASGVSLCTLKDGIYTDITATKNSDNYYEVRTSDYNNVELYIKTDLDTVDDINKLNIIIKENTVDYTATVYDIKGKYEAESSYMVFCSVCENRIKNYNSTIYQGDIVRYNGSYYKCTKAGVNAFETTVAPTGYYYYEFYFNNGDKVQIKNYEKEISYETRFYCHKCGKYFTNKKAMVEHLNESMSLFWDDMYSEYICCHKGFGNDKSALIQHFNTDSKFIKYYYEVPVYTLSTFKGCGIGDCGTIIEKGTEYESQKLCIIDSANKNYSSEIKADIEIPLSTTIEITKTWKDSDDAHDLRPETLKFNVFRSIDQENWTKLTENTDYKLEVGNKEGNTWKIYITDLARKDNEEKEYFFKVEEQELVYYQASYPDGKEPTYNETTGKREMSIENSLKTVDISGYVWLDGQTGIKGAIPFNTKMDEETGLNDIKVYLYYDDPNTKEIDYKKVTDKDGNPIYRLTGSGDNDDGYYEFKGYEIGNYYVEFEYDGINYMETKAAAEEKNKTANENDKINILDDSKANETNRENFNAKFQTITYGKAIGKDEKVTTLTYKYDNGKSKLETRNPDGTAKDVFAMKAQTAKTLYVSTTENINLGLVKRGTDIALSTDVSNAVVNINGQTTNYTFNNVNESEITIGNTQTNDNVSYNLNLYASDYNYRIDDYVTKEENKKSFKKEEQLKVYVAYELNLQNQSTETVRINEVKYTFDEKYSFIGFTDNSYNDKAQNSGNVLTINLKGLSLGQGGTKTLYLLFEVNNNDGLTLGNFSNYAEITSYSTDDGLIDTDSQPGNFMNKDDYNNDGEIDVEDDNDTARGLTIKLAEDTVRKITGKVFEKVVDEENKNVNDVIVQLIELKTVNGNVYEYIWQETVSGSGEGKKLNDAGTALEEYTYTKKDGEYEFNGFIPGDYIVRFIYGDGTTYDMTGNVIKYNGQDYKSTKDSNYNSEWYNSSSYTDGASVARDNEARRLETMAYSVNIDAEKGLLLKLLDNSTLNLTEKETLISIYNKYNDTYGTSDISINDASDEVIESVKKALLLKEVLPNTWMCAETSKIKVAVDTDDIKKTTTEINVDGITRNYVEEISNINLGLELRPATKIELEKYITGFKLTAANGQTLVNAYIDVNEYLNNPTDISNKVQGIRDNVTILDTVWQYEVAPTDINTIIDGASLEFEYTLVVKNIGETDYLSATLADKYNTLSIEEYEKYLKGSEAAGTVKDTIKKDGYNSQIGAFLGTNYYTGATTGTKVKTEVTNIRDYVNNDLRFITSGGDVAVDEDAPHTYRILRDDYTMQEATINTVLKTTKPTGKMENDGTAVMYKITLGKNPISATGNLNFENYIAEVMSYTNAAGRRSMESTPGNAEIIDHEHREGKTHEIDEADTARIQIGAATGEDGKTNYIIITAVIAGIAIVAAGVFAVKKYVIK